MIDPQIFNGLTSKIMAEYEPPFQLLLKTYPDGESYMAIFDNQNREVELERDENGIKSI